MTLQQKVLQMSGDSSLWDMLKLVTVEKGKYNDTPIAAGADTRLAIPPIGFADGPRGVVLNHSTAFPVAMARGASWDRDLQRRFGDVVGKEIRAQGGTLWGGVCVNLLRHPSWGRAQETLGEDPYLLGELSVASVEAVQAHNVMGCAKHYALNSIEETRTRVDARVDERTLREVYLPHFKRLADADVASFMSAYNKVNGDYCGESRHLLREILKEEWGYQGFVMSDFFMGVYDGKKAALAGLDLEMPWTMAYGKTLVAAVEKGEVPLAVVDEAVLRLLRRKIEYATRPDPMAYPASLVGAPEHAALAREVAEKGTVLLKNEGGLLPLDEAAHPVSGGPRPPGRRAESRRLRQQPGLPARHRHRRRRPARGARRGARRPRARRPTWRRRGRRPRPRPRWWSSWASTSRTRASTSRRSRRRTSGAGTARTWR